MIRGKIRARVPAVVLASMAVMAGTVPAIAKYDWLQFNFSPDKTGNNTLETTITPANVAQLKPLFTANLSDNPDGAPVLLTDVTTSSGVRDLIFVLGEHSNITAFDANTGAQIWTKNHGGGGITNSAPAIDPNRQFIYVNTSDGKAHKLNVGDGSEVTDSVWPVTTGSGKSSCQLTIATAKDGHKYLYCANQGKGRITTINLDTGTRHVFNLSASEQPDTETPSTSVSGPNPWSRAMPYDASLDLVFAMGATNNGNTWVAGHVWRQSWVALPADGSTTLSGGGGYPEDSYTPTDWATSVSHDQDIGSGGLGILPVGLSSKYPHLGVQPGKDHKIRILNLADMSGKGGPGHLGGELFLYPFEAMNMMRSELAIWTNPADHSVWALVPGEKGLAGLKVVIDGSGNPSLSLQWQNVGNFTTSAIVANNILFAATGGGEHTTTNATHELRAMDPTTGKILWSAGIGQWHWTSQIVANGIVYMCDGNSGGFGSGTGGHLMAWSIPNTLPTVATPTFNPPAGTYSSAQNVTISTTTTGASIRYTTDGSQPSETNGTLYSTPVPITQSTLLTAIAFKSGSNDSAVASANYTLTTSQQVAAPTFSPAPGTYPNAQSVTLSTTTPGASINYTTDGSTPTPTSGLSYSGPISVTATTTIKAIAFESGFTDSAVSTGNYTISTVPTTMVYEAELTGHTTTGATSTIQNDTNASGGQWVSLDATGTGQYIEYLFGAGGGSTQPNIPAGTYSVSLTYKTNNNRGILSLSVDGTTLGGTLDQYASSSSYPSHTFGTVTFPTTDNHIIRLTVTGKNGSSSSYVLSADKFTFTPVSSSVAVEAESLAYTASGATASVQTDTNASGGKWIELAGNSVGDFIDFPIPNVPAGTYSVQMKWKSNNNRGILNLKVDGTQVGGTLDQYASSSTYPTTTFGNVTFSTAGTHTIRLTVTGKNSASSGEVLSADEFILAAP